MKKDTTKIAYSMRQEILYTICAAAWKLCSKFIDSFAAFKAFYTQAFVNGQLVAVAKAKAMPGLLQSNNDRTNARIDLMLATRVVTEDWQSLKAYIEQAFIPEKVKAMLEAAGASFYKAAAGGNWDSTRSLISAAATFITNNVDILTNGDNMPATFQAQFQADGDACTAAATLFAEMETAKEQATNDKIDANNKIYAALVRLCKDAANVFKKEPAIRKQFTITSLVAANSGEGAASLAGYVTDQNGLAIENALVTSVEGVYTATTDEKGKYSIARVSATDVYTFTISAKGYQQVSQTISFTPGTARRANFTLSNLKVSVLVS